MIKLNKIFETKTDKIVQGGLGAFVVLGTAIHFGFLSGSELTEADLLSGSSYGLFDVSDFAGNGPGLGRSCDTMLELARAKVPTSGNGTSSYLTFETSEGVVSRAYSTSFAYSECVQFWEASAGTDRGFCAENDNRVLPELPILQRTPSGLPTELQGHGAVISLDYSNLGDGLVRYSIDGEFGQADFEKLVCVQP